MTLKLGSFLFLQFSAAAHILRENCAEMARDVPGQHAYEIFSIERTFLTILRFEVLNSRNLSVQMSQISVLFEDAFVTLLHAIHNCKGDRIAAVARHVRFS